MPTIDQAKGMAKRLRSALAARDIEIPHATSLELVAVELGHKDWNTAAAKLQPSVPDGISVQQAIPILRIFDVTKAREFYCDFLGFQVTMEHRHEPDLPLYMAVSRAGLELHLSEHHGDASPGSTAFVWMSDITDFHVDLISKHYGYGRPGIERQPWGDQMEVHDPFGKSHPVLPKASLSAAAVVRRQLQSAERPLVAVAVQNRMDRNSPMQPRYAASAFALRSPLIAAAVAVRSPR